MKTLIIGSGGREHALAWKCAQSADVEEVLVAPGNAGSALEPGVRNVDVSADDIEALAALAQAENIDLTIVGPEAPLASIVSTNSDCRALDPVQRQRNLRDPRLSQRIFWRDTTSRRPHTETLPILNPRSPISASEVRRL